MITLPSNISDLAAWLLLPAVLGIIATFFVNLLPVKYAQYTQVVRFVVYMLIAVVSVVLTKIPADVLEQYQPIFVALMAALAAFIGDSAFRGAQLIGIRMLIGRDQFHADFGHRLTGGRA